MADVETETRRLQVANLPPADSGRGIARLPRKYMDENGLTDGDVVEIVGKRPTPARAIGPYGDDEGLDIIRLDGLQRANAGVGSGDFVEVRKAVQAAGYDYESAELEFRPQYDQAIDAKDAAEKLFRLLDAIEEVDDVQNVYSNADISDEVLAQLQED